MISWLFRLLRRYREVDGLNMAAALSFYAILSLLPILLIVISVIGHFVGGSESLSDKVRDLIVTINPLFQKEFLDNLNALTSGKQTFGWLGGISLFWVAHFLYENLEATLNRVLGIKTPRHYLVTRLFFLIFLSGLTLLLSLPALASVSFSLLSKMGFGDFGELSFLYGPVGFFFSSWLSFIFIMLVVPNKRFSFSKIFLVGGAFAAMIHIARLFFRWYTVYALERYHLLYGSLTALILGALWIFYFCNILLLCVIGLDEAEE